MNHNDKFQPRDLTELREVAIPLLRKMIKGAESEALAMTAALLAHQHTGDVWSAATMTECVNGKVQLTTHALAGIMASSGAIRIEVLAFGPDRVTIKATRENFGEHTADWSIQRAEHSGYMRNPLYKTHPAEMLRAKCLRELHRVLASDLIGGAVDLDDTDDRAAAVQVEAETRTTAPVPTHPRLSANFVAPAQPIAPPPLALVDRIVAAAVDCGYGDDAITLDYLREVFADSESKPKVAGRGEALCAMPAAEQAEAFANAAARARESVQPPPVNDAPAPDTTHVAAVPDAPPTVTSAEPTSPAVRITRELRNAAEDGLIFLDLEALAAHLRTLSPEDKAGIAERMNPAELKKLPGVTPRKSATK